MPANSRLCALCRIRPRQDEVWCLECSANLHDHHCRDCGDPFDCAQPGQPITHHQRRCQRCLRVVSEQRLRVRMQLRSEGLDPNEMPAPEPLATEHEVEEAVSLGVQTRTTE